MTAETVYLSHATLDRLARSITAVGHVDDDNARSVSDALDDPVQRAMWQARSAARPDLRPAGTLRTGQALKVNGEWQRIVAVSWSARRTQVTLADGTVHDYDSAHLVDRRLEQDVTS